MSTYLTSLKALVYFLKKVRHKHWIKSLQKDIHEWETKKSTRHHLANFRGGMGSYLDYGIDIKEYHIDLWDAREWADPLFNELRVLCYVCAKKPQKSFTLEQLKKKRDHHHRLLSDMVSTEFITEEMPLYTHVIANTIDGTRCLDCGYGEIEKYEIERYLVRLLLPTLVLNACANEQLITMIDDVMALKIEHIKMVKQAIIETIKKSNLSIVPDKTERLRPCLLCHSEQTDRCRWFFTQEQGCFKAEKSAPPLKSEYQSELYYFYTKYCEQAIWELGWFSGSVVDISHPERDKVEYELNYAKTLLSPAELNSWERSTGEFGQYRTQMQQHPEQWQKAGILYLKIWDFLVAEKLIPEVNI